MATTKDHTITALKCELSFMKFWKAVCEMGSDKGLPVRRGTRIRPMINEINATISMKTMLTAIMV